MLISSKAEFPTDAIDMFLDSRIQKIVSVALLCCGMQPENVRNAIVFVWAYKIKCTCFESIFSSLPGKSQKTLNSTERLLAKLQPFFVDITIIVLMQQICIIKLSDQVLKLVCFNDLECNLIFL